MATTVNDMLAAARAVVPAITPAEAKGAVAVSRGLLEFRADPASSTRDPAFRPDRPILLYCGSGGRAALAGKTLRDLGFVDVRNLGGFKDWVAAGGKVEPG